MPENKSSFAESILSIKDSRHYSLSEMAMISEVGLRRLKSWIYDGVTPTPGIQKKTICLLESSQNPQSKALSRAMQNMHGLTWEEKKKRWRLRVTVSTGKKTVGRRVTMGIKSHDVRVAILTKDAILQALSQLGLTVIQKLQRRAVPACPKRCLTTVV